MTKKICLISSLIVFLLLSCGKKSTENNKVLSIEDLLVKNNEISGWTYAGQGWLANNISELYTFIDGAAEIYQRHNFVEGASQPLQGKIDTRDCHLTISIYSQRTETDAKSLFEDPLLGMSGAISWSGGAGKAAQYVRYGISQQLSFYQSSYYVHLQIDYDTDESLQIMQQFALSVAGKIR